MDHRLNISKLNEVSRGRTVLDSHEATEVVSLLKGKIQFLYITYNSPVMTYVDLDWAFIPKSKIECQQIVQSRALRPTGGYEWYTWIETNTAIPKPNI